MPSRCLSALSSSIAQSDFPTFADGKSICPRSSGGTLKYHCLGALLSSQAPLLDCPSRPQCYRPSALVLFSPRPLRLRSARPLLASFDSVDQSLEKARRNGGATNARNRTESKVLNGRTGDTLWVVRHVAADFDICHTGLTDGSDFSSR